MKEELGPVDEIADLYTGGRGDLEPAVGPTLLEEKDRMSRKLGEGDFSPGIGGLETPKERWATFVGLAV